MSDASGIVEPETEVASERVDVPASLITLMIVGFLVAISGAAAYAYRRLR